MKKLVIVVLIVLLGAAGWAAATYVVGGQVEKRYVALLDQPGQWGPLRWTGQSYERGFLRSRARTVVEIDVPQAPETQDGAMETVRLTFDHSLRHGPLPGGGAGLMPKLVLIETRLVDVEPGGRGYADFLDEFPQFREVCLRTSFGFDGGGRTRLELPAFEKNIEAEGATVRFDGMRLDTRFSCDLSDLSGEVGLSGLQLRMADGHLQWDGMESSFDLEEAFPMVYLGRSEAHCKALQMAFEQTPAGPRNIALKGFDVRSESASEDDGVRYRQTLQLAGVTVDGENYGPGELEVIARNLDGAALSRFQTAILDVYRTSAFQPEELVERTMQGYQQLFADLAQGSPELELRRFEFATPQGEVAGSARVKLHGGQGPMALNLLTLMTSLEAEAQVTADDDLVEAAYAASLVEELKTARRRADLPPLSDEELTAQVLQQVEAQLDTLVRQQYLVRKGGKLSAHAVFDRGALRLNDRSLLPGS